MYNWLNETLELSDGELEAGRKFGNIESIIIHILH